MSSSMKPILHIEVIKQLTSKCKSAQLESHVYNYLKNLTKTEVLRPNQILSNFNDEVIKVNVKQIDICEAEYHLISTPSHDNEIKDLDLFEVKFYIYQLDSGGLHSEEIEDDESGDSPGLSCASNHCVLPSLEFNGLWDSLVFDDCIKETLLQYAKTSMRFSHCNVDSNIISWNRVVLLHGPPGTGKTSLCKAIAQKLSIRLQNQFKISEFIEINSHSLFSKYFSESGKLVQKMFDKIKKAVEYEESLVCLLIDEIESLTRARESVLSGTEPSDGVRVVNAVLTQLDQLKRYPNVLIFTTSNLTGAIDLAFVDRADIKQYIGFPSTEAVRKIYNSCKIELIKSGLITSSMNEIDVNKRLTEICRKSSGLSGRTLRKIPFLAFVKYIPQSSIDIEEFLTALNKTVDDMVIEKKALTRNSYQNGLVSETL